MGGKAMAWEFVSLCFRAGSFTRFHRMLRRVLRHLALNDFVQIHADHVGHLDAVDHHIGQLFVHMLPVSIARFVAPLEAFEELAGFDADGFGHIAGSVELPPVTLVNEFTDLVNGLVGNHDSHTTKKTADIMPI